MAEYEKFATGRIQLCFRLNAYWSFGLNTAQQA
jgi:hypothetical protein